MHTLFTGTILDKSPWDSTAIFMFSCDPFLGRGEVLDMCELENVPEMQKCPKTFVHDCSHYDTSRRIKSSLLTDNPPSPGKVDHTIGVYVSYSFRTVVWVLLRPTRTR